MELVVELATWELVVERKLEFQRALEQLYQVLIE
jgi:hypothetical protein